MSLPVLRQRGTPQDSRVDQIALCNPDQGETDVREKYHAQVPIMQSPSFRHPQGLTDKCRIAAA
jgi:hypothetical protein